MAKYLVETYYTCTFKVNHYLDDVNETELKNLEKRDDGKFEVLDVKLDNRKTKSLDPKNNKVVQNKKIDVVITSGGTGITGSDGTPEAVKVLLDKEIDGFGELFRSISYSKIKTSSLQSRALAGVANATFIFVLPGSVDACKTAWEKIIQYQLNSDTKPCNLVMLMPRLR